MLRRIVGYCHKCGTFFGGAKLTHALACAGSAKTPCRPDRGEAEMGGEATAADNWDRIRRIAEKLDSPHAEQVFVAKEYTKADLRRDLLATIPKARGGASAELNQLLGTR